MRVIVTAIGSMSAECTVATLNSLGIGVVATDIFDERYHPISRSCFAFEKVGRACSDPIAYVRSISEIAARYRCSGVIPLTDPEVDVLSTSRNILESDGLSLWLAGSSAISCARDCLLWSQALRDGKKFRIIPTYSTYKELQDAYTGRFVAKRINGRSSEGLFIGDTNSFEVQSEYEKGYVFQPFMEGDIVTVDFVRHAKSGRLIVLPRKELLRTKNGAGTVVEILDPCLVYDAVQEISLSLNLTGVMNCEFILSDGNMYLMDINPRFSAGISFSKLAGYDFVSADVDCYTKADVPMLKEVKVGAVFVKRFCDFV